MSKKDDLIKAFILARIVSIIKQEKFKRNLEKRLEKVIRNTGLAFEDYEMETLVKAILNADLFHIIIKKATPETEVEVMISKSKNEQ